jgi:hypothetical protein
LRDVGVGETGYVVFTSMKADAEGFCYLDPEAAFRGRNNVNSIRVTRGADGFHVGTVRAGVGWEVGNFTPGSRHYWYPVESISDDLDANSG